MSLKEALNTELANAMEEEVEEDQEKFKKDEEQHQDEHKNHTKERLRKRMEEQRKKQRGKKKQEVEFNPDKEKLEIGDRVEIKVTETTCLSHLSFDICVVYICLYLVVFG